MTDHTATRPRLDGLLASIEIHVAEDFFRDGAHGYFIRTRTRTGARRSDSDVFFTEADACRYAADLAESLFTARQDTTAGEAGR